MFCDSGWSWDYKYESEQNWANKSAETRKICKLSKKNWTLKHKYLFVFELISGTTEKNAVQ